MSPVTTKGPYDDQNGWVVREIKSILLLTFLAETHVRRLSRAYIHPAFYHSQLGAVVTHAVKCAAHLGSSKLWRGFRHVWFVSGSLLRPTRLYGPHLNLYLSLNTPNSPTGRGRPSSRNSTWRSSKEKKLILPNIWRDLFLCQNAGNYWSKWRAV